MLAGARTAIAPYVNTSTSIGWALGAAHGFRYLEMVAVQGALETDVRFYCLELHSADTTSPERLFNSPGWVAPFVLYTAFDPSKIAILRAAFDGFFEVKQTIEADWAFGQILDTRTNDIAMNAPDLRTRYGFWGVKGHSSIHVDGELMSYYSTAGVLVPHLYGEPGNAVGPTAQTLSGGNTDALVGPLEKIANRDEYVMLNNGAAIFGITSRDVT